MEEENLFPKSCPLTSSAVLVSDDDDDGDGYDLGTVVNIYINNPRIWEVEVDQEFKTILSNMVNLRLAVTVMVMDDFLFRHKSF